MSLRFICIFPFMSISYTTGLHLGMASSGTVKREFNANLIRTKYVPDPDFG